MPMKTYAVARHHGEQELRKGHIYRVHGVDFALHKVAGGYACDHPRSGLAIGQLDAVDSPRFSVSLKVAAENLHEFGPALVEANIEVFKRAETLNEGFA